MGLLTEIGNYGLEKLKDVEIFERRESKQWEKKEAQSMELQRKNALELEKDALLEKSCVCPLCDFHFKYKAVKRNRTRLIETDLDLRPRYDHVDTLKYGVILCPRCGYAALERYFNYMTDVQAKLIKEKISVYFVAKEDSSPIYTYETALERHQLALATAIVRKSKASEKSYICLRTGWLLRGMAENLNPSMEDYLQKKKDTNALENEFLENAFDGFIMARQTEIYPMCGMEKCTVDYLLAALALRFDKYDLSNELTEGILASHGAPARLKNKAYHLKDILVEKMK